MAKFVEPLFRSALCVATLLMLGLSWPLWVGIGTFPKVPFVSGIPDLPELVEWIFFGLLIGLIAAGLIWKRALGLALIPLVLLILFDQHRFQPWAFQFGLMALALSCLSKERAFWCCQLFLIALYVHSGLSKLDATFVRELGGVFLERLAGPRIWDWPGPLRIAAILAMPAFELVVGLGLVFQPTRRWALVGALGLHLALISILGPWGLGHSPNVLAWNVALMVQVLILFGPDTRQTPDWSGPKKWQDFAVLGAFLAVAILPITERWGAWDAWPSFALYASHVERTQIDIHESSLQAFPESIQQHLLRSPVPGQGRWYRLDLTNWSRAERGTPPYPQGRALNGVAEALAARYAGGDLVRVIHWGRANRWTGARIRVERVGLSSIRAWGNQYLLNAHPAIGMRNAEVLAPIEATESCR